MFDKSARTSNRVSDLQGLKSIFLIKAIMKKGNVMINVAREYVNGTRERLSISMIDVNITDIIVETKKPSTVNFIMLSMSRLRAVRRITPGMI
jgi:hypothetical protein